MGVSEAVLAELLDAYNDRKKPEALAATLDKLLDELARDPTYRVLPDSALWIVLRAVQREAEINIAASEGLVGPALQIGGIGGAAGLAVVTVAGALALPLLSVGLIIAGSSAMLWAGGMLATRKKQWDDVREKAKEALRGAR